MAHYGRSEAGWWDPESGEGLDKDSCLVARADSLIDCARNLENVQSETHQQNLWNAQLYSNRELANFDWGNGALHRASLSPVNRTGENLVLSVIDTLVAQVGKQRPKAKPMTRGGSWKLRRQAKLLDKFLYGEFVRLRIHDLGKRVFRDACIFGFGALYLHIDGDDRLACERVFPDELLVDQMEVVACGRIRHVYRRRVLPVEVVADLWDVDEEELAEIASTATYLEKRAIGKGYIPVVEGWQLALGSRTGHYMAAVAGKVLKEKEYDQKTPPFIFYHWHDPDSGFYSPSAVEQALPYQIRLNEINEVIRASQELMGVPRLLVAKGSQVNPYEVDNLVAKIINYTGIKPEAVTWPAVNAELYNERDRCWGQCRDQFGVGSMATSAQAPAAARFDSSPAFREFNAIQDDRLADPSQRLERFYLDVAEGMIRTIDHFGIKPKTVWSTGGQRHGRMEVIDWDAIDIDKDSYVLQLEATSVYDQTPSATRDDLEKQLAEGIITPEDYRLEVSHPDDSSELSLQASAAADLRRVIDLLEDGKWEHPTPVQDLVNGVEVVSLALLNLNQFENDDPDIDLDVVKANFLDWIVEARGILDDGADDHEAEGEMMGASMAPGDPAQMAMAEGGMGMPGGDPMMGQPPPMPGPGMGPGVGPPMIPVPESAGMATNVVHTSL